MGNSPSMTGKFPFEDGEELSTPPPPPPGTMLMQGREYGALGLAKIRTSLRSTPETIAAEERFKAACGGLCPPWGHTYYPHGNEVSFQGTEQLLKDPWPDAWLASQPVLAQVDELTAGAWWKRPATQPPWDCTTGHGHAYPVLPGQTEKGCCGGPEGPCCGCLNQHFSNYVHEYRVPGPASKEAESTTRTGAWTSGAHQRLAAAAWIIKLNEVLNPHGLVADLYERTVFHVHKHGGDDPDSSTSYTATKDTELLLRLFLWSTRAAQAAPQSMQVAVPPGAAGGYTLAVAGPDGQQYNATVPPGLMPGQSFMLQLPARAATAPPTLTLGVTVPPGVAAGETIGAMGPDGKQYSMTVPDKTGPGQMFQFQLPPDAAWWRSVEPQVGPQGMEMVRCPSAAPSAVSSTVSSAVPSTVPSAVPTSTISSTNTAVRVVPLG